jgi:hypothetical protein
MKTATLQQKKVIEAIVRYAEVNNLRVGDKLPSIRNISEEFGIGHVTVARTIQFLAQKGFLSTQRKAGTVLMKELSPVPQDDVYRIIMIQYITMTGNNSGTEFLADQSFAFIGQGIKHSFPHTELITVWHYSDEGEDVLENTVSYHYSHKKNREKVMFLLGGCPRWVKNYFQERHIPCIIVGGAEEGITLPNITIDIQVIMDELIQTLDVQKAFPLVYLVAHPPVGEHQYYFDRFRKLSASQGEKKCKILRVSDSPEIFRGQIMQLLSGQDRPRTVVVQGDQIGCWLIRICFEVGIKVPDQLNIISTESSALGEQLTPSLTGIYRDRLMLGERLGEMLIDFFSGKDLEGTHVAMKPVLVFRESFKQMIENGR